MKARRTVAQKSLIILAGAIALLALAFTVYVNIYYHGDSTAYAAIADTDGPADGVTVEPLSDGSIAFVAEKPLAGMVFYPGAKVEAEAYAPLLTNCARAGITSIVVRPPFNLAILNAGAAGGVLEQFPEIETWVLAGHSLGGSMAGDYTADHADTISLLVFLAAYPHLDLSNYGGAVLSIVGSEDTVINRTNYEEAKDKCPHNTQEVVISGGNHAGFGNYGEQDGDGKATITSEQQQAQTVAAILNAVESTEANSRRS
ncbi:MAG: hypothetical protein IJ125_00550 [Atopobiaceae bacterium]|nr:hypothetical protein [Atopobiaceae bacterium]